MAKAFFYSYEYKYIIKKHQYNELIYFEFFHSTLTMVHTLIVF